MRSKVTSIVRISFPDNVGVTIFLVCAIPVGHTVCYTISIENWQRQTRDPRLSEAQCCFLCIVCGFLFFHKNYNEVLYISADVMTPKRVNLKVIAPRVNSSFYFTNIDIFFSLQSYQRIPFKEYNPFLHFVPSISF